jgi:hypothetical protein
MPITFAPVVAYSGHDPTPTPSWQMVPVGGQRFLILTGAAGLVPRVRHPAFLEAVQFTGGGVTLLTLTGKSAGRTFVEWVPSLDSSGPVRADQTLEVSVKALKTINTAFHYVNDGHQQITNRSIADLNAMLAAANHMLTPQSNVTIARKSAAALPIAQNLRQVVRFSSHLPGVAARQHEWDDVTAHADATADFNVFFVVEYEQDDTPLVDDTRAGTIASEKNCILEDNITSAAETLAHETIHLLGIDDHSANTGDLIASGAVRTGWLITKAQANIINTSGT